MGSQRNQDSARQKLVTEAKEAIAEARGRAAAGLSIEDQIHRATSAVIARQELDDRG